MIDKILDKFDEIIKSVPTTKTKGSNNTAIIKDYAVIKHFEIDVTKRLLIVENNQYNIPAFFNINKANARNYKTLDYIFTHLGLKTSDYLKKEHESTNNCNITLL